jgi:phage terminase Nu1 subunit (DNA packaging protein)
MAGKITLDLTDDNDILVSVGILKDLPILQVSKMTISNWINDGLPYEMQGKRRTFPISKAIKWLIEHGKIDVSTEILDEIDRTELPPDLRDKLASAELKEFKLAKEKGLVIDRDEVERQAFEIGKKLKESLKTIPIRISDELASLNDAHTIRNRLEDEVNKILEDVSKDIESAI